MTRHERYGELDEAPKPNGDQVFVGVDERMAPPLVSASYVSRAKNARFVDGVIKPRGGITVLRCMINATTAFLSNPTTERVNGGCVFSDPNGHEWIIVAAAGKTWRTRPNSVAQEISLNSATLPTEVQFTQCFGKLIMWRGVDLAPLELTSFEAGWTAVTMVSSGAGEGTGTAPIPNSAGGCAFFQNRLLVPFNYAGAQRDVVAVGDIGNYTRYKYPAAAFRINQGEADSVVAVVPFGRQAVVIGKGNRIVAISGLAPDSYGDYTSAVMDTVTEMHGFEAVNGVCLVGRDLYYVSRHGIFSLQLTEENAVKGLDLPLSMSMPASWARVNEPYLTGAQLTWHASKLYAALPLDDAERLMTDAAITLPAPLEYDAGGLYAYSGLVVGQKYRWEPKAGQWDYGIYVDPTGGTSAKYYYTTSPFDFVAVHTDIVLKGEPLQPVSATIKPIYYQGYNNGVMVFDFINGAWAGVDEGDGVVDVKRWLVVHIGDEERLVALGNDGILRLWEDGVEDEKYVTLTQEYVDMLVMAAPANADTVQAGATGDTVTAATASVVNLDHTWGCATAGVARYNLWADAYAKGGYQAAATHPWTAVFAGVAATVAQIEWGVRFTGADLSAAVHVNGVHWGGGTGDWAKFDYHTGTEIQPAAIVMEILLRGYAVMGGQEARAKRLCLLLSGWAPQYTVALVGDRTAAEKNLATDAVRSPTAYELGNLTAWDSTNVNADHATLGREDYSVVMPALGFCGEDVNVDIVQPFERRWPVEMRGGYVQARITNEDGVLWVRGAMVEQVQGDRREK